MTEELIATVAEAEAKTKRMKVDAEVEAARILAQAETEASRTGETSAQVTKAYAETQIRNAQAEAQARYDKTVSDANKSAKIYCANALECADDTIARIVGRIVNGNR